VAIHDPIEADPALTGDVELIEVETGARRRVTISPGARDRYRRLFREHGEGLEAYCRSRGIGCSRTSTAVPFDAFLLQMMRAAGSPG
jgi:hypothetical protein